MKSQPGAETPFKRQSADSRCNALRCATRIVIVARVQASKSIGHVDHLNREPAQTNTKTLAVIEATENLLRAAGRLRTDN